MFQVMLLPVVVLMTFTANLAPMTSEEIDALWDFSNPAASRQRFEQALEKSPESADELRTQIARTWGLERQFDLAKAELKKIESPQSALVRVRYDLEWGRILNSEGNPKVARPFFKQALKAAQAAGLDYYAVDAAHMLGIVTEGKESIQWNESAIKLATASKEARARGWLGSLLNNLAWTYHDMGEFEKALEKFQAALEFRRGAGKPEPERIARWSVARCLRSLKRFDEALAIQRELEKLSDDGFVWEEIAELLLALCKKEEARPYFRKAFDALSADEWLTKNEPARIARLKELGA